MDPAAAHGSVPDTLGHSLSPLQNTDLGNHSQTREILWKSRITEKNFQHSGGGKTMILDTLEWVRTIWPSVHHPSFKVAQLRAKKYLPWPVIYPTGEREFVKVSSWLPHLWWTLPRNWVRSHLIRSTESWAGGQEAVGTAADTMISEDIKGMLILAVSQILLRSPHMSHREQFTCRSHNWPRGTPVLHVPPPHQHCGQFCVLQIAMWVGFVRWPVSVHKKSAKLQAKERLQTRALVPLQQGKREAVSSWPSVFRIQRRHTSLRILPQEGERNMGQI